MVFGTGQRAQVPRTLSPGPIYDVASSVGRQVLSTAPSAPSAPFGTDARDHRNPSSSDAVGPGSFDLPSSLGSSQVFPSAPAFSLTGRTQSPLRSSARDSPGPGAYAATSLLGRSPISNVRSPPAFSLRPRTVEAGARTGTGPSGPSPISYSPSIAATRRASPSFSIRRRTPSPTKRESSDLGPGSYDILGVTGIGARGPGITRAVSPAFSFRPRTVDPGEVAARRSPSPGPGAYEMPSTLGPSPLLRSNGAFTMRGRLRSASRGRAASPGPGAYRVPDGVGPQALSTAVSSPQWGFGFGDRPGAGGPSASSLRRSPSPGPAAYDVPSAFRPLTAASPSGITLRGKLHHGSATDLGNRAASPGPAAYPAADVTVLTTHLATRTPGLSKAERLSPLGATAATRARSPSASPTHGGGAAGSGPSPLAFLINPDIAAVKPSAPSFSLRSRHEVQQKQAEVEGPAAVNLQGTGLHSVTRRNTPSWTLKGRWSGKDKDNGVPGPGAYGELDLRFYEASVGLAASSTTRGSPGLLRAGGNCVTMTGGTTTAYRAPPGGGSPVSRAGSPELLDVYAANKGFGGGGGAATTPSTLRASTAATLSPSASPSSSLGPRISAGPGLQALLNA